MKTVCRSYSLVLVLSLLCLHPIFAQETNIHSALFWPESLDFWVVIADSENPAAHTRYTDYNLAELLRPGKLQ